MDSLRVGWVGQPSIDQLEKDVLASGFLSVPGFPYLTARQFVVRQVLNSNTWKPSQLCHIIFKAGEIRLFLSIVVVCSVLALRADNLQKRQPTEEINGILIISFMKYQSHHQK